MIIALKRLLQRPEKPATADPDPYGIIAALTARKQARQAGLVHYRRRG